MSRAFLRFCLAASLCGCGATSPPAAEPTHRPLADFNLLHSARCLAIDPDNSELYLGADGGVQVYSNQGKHLRSIPIESLEAAESLAIDAKHHELLAAGYAHSKGWVVCSLPLRSRGPTRALRVLTGQQIPRIAVDPKHDEIYVLNCDRPACLRTYRRLDQGWPKAQRTLQGGNTEITGNSVAVAYLPDTDQLAVANRASHRDDSGRGYDAEAFVSIFPRRADGNIAPSRRFVLSGEGPLALADARGLYSLQPDGVLDYSQDEPVRGIELSPEFHRLDGLAFDRPSGQLVVLDVAESGEDRVTYFDPASGKQSRQLVLPAPGSP